MGTYQKASDIKQQLTPSRPLKPEHKKLALVILLVLIVAAIAGGWLYKRATKPIASKEETIVSTDQALQINDSVQAIAQLKEVYRAAASPEGKADAAAHLGVRYAENEDYKSALKYYLEADKFYDGKNIDILLGIAEASASMGDNAKAKDYYQQALDYYKPLVADNLDYEVIVLNLEKIVSRLDQ